MPWLFFEANDKAFFDRAAQFSLEVREKSARMMVTIEMERQGSGRKLPSRDTELLLHPWSLFIQPGKELFL